MLDYMLYAPPSQPDTMMMRMQDWERQQEWASYHEENLQEWQGDERGLYTKEASILIKRYSHLPSHVLQTPERLSPDLHTPA